MPWWCVGRHGRAGARCSKPASPFTSINPAMYHCKVMIVDDCWTSVGSTNFDNRSFSPERRGQSKHPRRCALPGPKTQTLDQDIARSASGSTLERLAKAALDGKAGRTLRCATAQPAVMPRIGTWPEIGVAAMLEAVRSGHPFGRGHEFSGASAGGVRHHRSSHHCARLSSNSDWPRH